MLEEDGQPTDGWRLLDALWHLQIEPHFQVFAASAKSGYDVDHSRSVAWRGLVERINRGEITLRARRLGNEPQVVSPDMLDDAKPDYAANRLTCCGEIFYSVRLFNVLNAVPPFAAPTVRSRPPTVLLSRRRGNSFEAEDEPLLQEMDDLIRSGKATGAQHAARFVFSKTKGKTQDAIVKRLASKYNRWAVSQSGPSGQS